MPTSEPRRLADFEGRWSLTRRIVHHNAPAARFEGTAVWTPEEGRLISHESGTLTVASQPPMQAERTYHWHPDLSVHFDDGRFFHKVPAAGGASEHWCDPDSYRGRYDFSDWPCFRVMWDVTGPRKSYRMQSLYRRL